jgi:hypothetical protein
MHNSYLQQPRGQLSVHRQCPDYDSSRQSCLASTWQTSPNDRQKTRYCATDDYDNCPLYLCNALRSSQPCGLDRDNLLSSGK